MAKSRQDLSFVLVRTQFASNLGSAVRVMRNMGFGNLILVRPECEVGIEARSFAMKGADILDRALFLPTLEAAAEKLGILIGTTGRFRGQRPQLIDCPTLSREVLPRMADSSVGIVFGSEDNGLRREELRLCQWLVEIPTAPGYSVINLAQSVAIVAYELYLASKNWTSPSAPSAASVEQVEALLERTAHLLDALELSTRVSVPRLMQRIRKIAGRSRLEREDVNMLHGLLKEIERRTVGGPGAAPPANPRRTAPEGEE